METAQPAAPRAPGPVAPLPTPPARRRTLIRLGLSIPVLLGATWLVFAHADGAAVRASLQGVQPGWVLGALLLMAILVAVRALRWVLLVVAVADVPTATATRVGLIGYMAIDLLPLRAGELVRPVLLQRQAGLPFGAGMATCVIERVLDLLGVLALLLLTLTFAELPSLNVSVLGLQVDLAVQGRNAALLATAVFALPGLVLVLSGERGEAALAALLRPLPRPLARTIMGLSIAYREAHRAIGRPRVLGAAAALTAVGWTLNLCVQWTLMEGFGLRGFGALQVGFLSLVVAVALMLPSPAGGLGVFEAGAVAGLMLFDVDPSVAAAFALALHAVHTGVTVGIGFGALLGEGVRFSDLLPSSRGRPADSAG